MNCQFNSLKDECSFQEEKPITFKTSEAEHLARLLSF
jgi:hypothetical protein